MKKTQEIIGLPIISISDGIEVGRVKNIIINAAKGAIDYIVVDSGIQILSAKIIPTVNILGIGEYALTIENEEAINDLSKIPSAIDLLQKNIQVKGTKVLTKKGRLIGEVGDIYVDESENCNIVGLEYIADITHKKIRIIPRESVITFGKNLVVVNEDVEGTLLDKPGDLDVGSNVHEIEKKNLMSNGPYDNSDSSDSLVHETDKFIAAEGNSLFKEIDTSYQKEQPESEKDMKSIDITMVPQDIDDDVTLDAILESDDNVGDLSEKDVEINFGQDGSSTQESLHEVAGEGSDNGVPFQDTQNSDAGASKASTAPQGQSNASSLFEQRQKQYLNGRKATKTITGNSGAVIISEGITITDEIIELAKENGKLIELVMNNKA